MNTYINKAKYLFKTSFLAISASILLSTFVIAQTYSPNNGNFPHGGIKSEVTKGSDNGDGDGDGDASVADYQDDCVTHGICNHGLQNPSFNNFTDSWVGADLHFEEGITDEREFLVLRNYTNGDNTFTDSINVKAGDIIQGRSYVHNNGTADDPNTDADESVIANNVTFRLPGFHIIGQDASGHNIYESDIESDANGNFYPSHSISASNVISGTETVSDDAVVTSNDGKKFKLQYTADDSYIKTVSAFAGHTPPSVNPDALVAQNGDNIGQVRGCKQDSFYLYTAFRVVDASAKDYDLSINKYVEKETTYSNNGQKVEQKNVSAAAGEELVYKLDYENLQTSAVTPSGTKIYDKYDTQKLEITWLDSRCTNNATYSQTKGLITCTALDLAPGQKHTFYFKGIVKTGATGTINNDAEVIPDNNTNPDDNTGNKGDLNRNPNDLDTNGANDDSNATVTVIENPTYDLSINKYVEKETVYSNNGQKVEQKNVSAGEGEELVYRLAYENNSNSTGTPSGTKVYDKYDTQKLEITWLDSKCTNNASYSQTKGLITCTAYDLAPGQNHAFYFKGIVKTGATGTINNDVEIIPDNNTNPDDNTGNKGDLNRNPNDLDTNGANDDSNATVTVIESPINGTCGTAAATYPAGTTEYPAGSTFCETGTASPSNPDFPASGQTVTWDCLGQNGGSNANPKCSATTSEDTAQVDIEIKKSVNNKYYPDIAEEKAGNTVTYKLEYKNNTNGVTAKNVIIKDTPDSERIDMDSLIFQTEAGVSCKKTQDADALVAVLQGEYIECTVGNLAYSPNYHKITYTAKIKDNVPVNTNIDNKAKITTDTPETNTQNNSSHARVKVIEGQDGYDLQIEKKVEGLKNTTAKAGDTLTYTLTYKNNTPNTTAKDVKIYDVFDTEKLDEYSVAFKNPLPAGVTCETTEDDDFLVYVMEGEHIKCSIGTLSYGEEYTITYTVKVLDTVKKDDVIKNIAEIKPNPDEDINNANDTSEANVTVVTNTVTPTPTPTPTPINGVCGSGAKTYSNTTTSYPAGTQFCSHGTVSPNPPAFPAEGSSVTWTCNGSNGGSNTTCTASRYSSGTSGGAGGGSGGGCNTNANLDLNITQYIKVGDGEFELAKTRETAAHLIENKTENVVYKVIVSNAGNASAYNVKIKNGFSSSDGVTHGAVQTESGALYSDGIFTLVAAVPANGSREFTYATTLANDGNATGLNTVRIESFDTDYKCPKIDSKKGVGRTSATYVKTNGTEANPDYTLDKTADKHAVKTGEIVTYTLSLKNTGNVDMKNVVLVDKFPSEFLEPTERFKGKLVDNRTLQFKQKFLPVGTTFSVPVEMKVREGVPTGTEIKNILTASSTNVEIKDKSMETVIISEGDIPACPTGYKWNPELNTCKKITIPRNIQTGLDTPYIPLGIMMLGIAFILRRDDIAKLLS